MVKVLIGNGFNQKLLCNMNEYQISFLECSNCHPECLQCKGPSSSDCFQCRNYKYKGECVSKCPQNFFDDNNDGQCNTCNIIYCKQCQDSKYCQICEDKFTLSDNREYCIYQSADQYAYMDGQNGKKIAETSQCQDQYATNEMGRYCQAIPLCIEENFVNELREKCFDKSNTASSIGIRMIVMQDSVIFYNERQANIYSLKEYKYIDSIKIRENVVKIVYYQKKIYIMYTTMIEIFHEKTLIPILQAKQPENMLNNRKSFLFELERYESLLLTTSIENDSWIIQNLETLNILADEYIGQQILDIRLENTLKILLITTLQKIEIIQLKYDYYQITLNRAALIQTIWSQDYIIQSVFSLIYYSLQNKPYALFFDGYSITVADLIQFQSAQYEFKKQYYSASIVQERGLLSIHYINSIEIYDLDSIINGKDTRSYILSTEGRNFLLAYSSPFLYVTSKEISQSSIYVFDTDFSFVQEIPLKQGKVTQMYLRKPFDDQDKETIVVCQEDNVFDVQGVSIKRQLIENCFNSSVKFFGQTVSFLNGFVTDKIRGIEFYVSLNIYGKIVFIIRKNKKVIKYKEISHPDFFDLTVYQPITMFINEIDMKIKLFGLISRHERLVIVFSYFSFSVDYIERYTDILFISEKLLVVQNSFKSDNLLYIKNDFEEKPSIILQNNNNIATNLENDLYYIFANYSFLSEDENKSIYSIIVIEKATYQYCQNTEVASEYIHIDFISVEQVLFISSTQFLVFNLKDCSLQKSLLHGITNRFRDIQILEQQNMLFLDEYQQIQMNSNIEDVHKHNYHIFNLTNFELIQSIKPTRIVNGKQEEVNESYIQGFFLNSNYQQPQIKNLLILISKSNTFLQGNQTILQYLKIILFHFPFFIKIHSQILYLNQLGDQNWYIKQNIQDQNGLCEVFISEYLLENLIFQNTRTYTTLQDCESLRRWGPEYLNQYKSVFLFDQKIFGSVQEYLQIGCSYQCMDLFEIQRYDDRVIYQEKILPNFSKILSENSLFFPSENQLKKYIIFAKYNIIMVEYQTMNKQSIKLIRYPSKEEIFTYTFTKVCPQILAHIVEFYNVLLICDSDFLLVFDLNNLKSLKFNTFNVSEICRVEKPQLVIETGGEDYVVDCIFSFSQFDPIIYINGRGVYNYMNNTYTSHPQLVFDMRSRNNLRQGNSFFSQFESREIKYKEQYNVIIAIMLQNIIIYDRLDNFKQQRTPLKLNSKNYYFEEDYFATINDYQNQKILQIYNYYFVSMTYFEEEPNLEFKSPYYFDCAGCPRLFIIYTMKLVGYIYPFTHNDEPFLIYQVSIRDKNFSVQLCSDEYIILLVNLSGTDQARYEIQIISYQDKQIQKAHSIRPDQLILRQLIQGFNINAYYKNKGFLLIQNVIISLLDSDSDLIYLLPTQDFVYDEINDYGIIIDRKDNNYIQFVDFSLIFPFNINSYSFANEIQLGPYQFGYTNSTTHEFINKWTIFYNSQLNAIYFYDFQSQIETKLQLDEKIIPRNHRILYKIEKLAQPDEIDPEQRTQYPNEKLFKQIIFACIFNDQAVIFKKDKILQYLPLKNYEKNIMEARITYDKETKTASFSKLTMDASTQLYSIQKINLNLPTKINVGRFVYTCFFYLEGFPNLAIIDSNNNIILEEDVFATLPLEYSYQKINQFNVIVNDKTNQFLIIVGLSNRISVYNNQLNLILELDTLSGGIQDTILEEKYQYLLLITENQLLVYRYTFNQGDVKITKIIPQIYFNLLSRNQNKLSKINDDHVAVISKSLLSMYKITKESVQYAYSIRNKHFNNIQNAAIFDDNRFLLIWDLHKLYLYDISPDNGNLFQIFQREYTHIKVLFTGQYWDDNRLFIRLIGVTATNVFDIRKEVKNLNLNVVKQVQNQQRQSNTASNDDLSYQCLQRSNLYQQTNDQAAQVDYLISKSYQKIYRIIFNVQYENQAILIPQKSQVESSTKDLQLIYNLNNKNIQFLQHADVTEQATVFKNIKFQNGSIDTYSLERDDQDHRIITQYLYFSQLEYLSFNNISFKKAINIKFCNKINLNDVILASNVEYLYIEGSNLFSTYFKAANIAVSTKIIKQNFIKIIQIRQVLIQNIAIQLENNIKTNSNISIESNDEEYPVLGNIQPLLLDPFVGYIHLNYIEFLEINNFKVQNLRSEINILSSSQVENVKIFNMLVEDINQRPSNNNTTEIDAMRFSIIDIKFSLKKVELSNVTIQNCLYDKLIKVNNTFADDWNDLSKIYSSKDLEVILKNITVQNISPKQLLEEDFIFYNILQMQATTIWIQNFVIKNITNITSTFFFQKVQNMMLEDINFSQIKNVENIISINNLASLYMHKITIQDITNIGNCLLLQDAQIVLNQVVIINPDNQKNFINQSAVKVAFQSEQSTILILNSIFQGLKNKNGNGTALNIVNAKSAKLQSVQFKNNYCILNGGAIYSANSKIMIHNTTIYQNFAVLSGGGVYLLNSQFMLDEGFFDHQKSLSYIQNNGAQVGGGIRYISIFIPLLIQKNSEIINSNKARFFGNDFTMYPKQIIVITNNDFNSVRSSLSSIKQKIQFYWIDEQGNKLKYYDDDDPILELQNSFNIDPQFQDLIQELQSYKEVKLQSNDIIFNSIGSSIDIKGKNYYSSQGFQYIEIESSFILSPEQFSSFNLIAPLKHIQKFYLSKILKSTEKVNVKFRSCEIGEIINEFKGFSHIKYSECFLCSNNTYSLQKPETIDVKCQACPDYARSCQGNLITANQGYWREPGTSYIEECYNQPLKCTREDPEKNQCSEGAFGPRCESCDYQNEIYKEYYYGKSGKYNCSRFEKKDGFGKEIAITILLLLIFGLYQGFSVLKINKQMSNQLKMYYLKKGGFVNYQVTLSKSGFSSLVKFFVGYFQILQILLQFRFQIPQEVTSVITFVGNPLEVSLYSLDIIFIKLGLHKKLEIVYLRLIWLYINSCIYFLLSVIISSIYTCIKKRKYKIAKICTMLYQTLLTAAIYVYYSIYLNLVEIIVNIISCQRIGSRYYILADSQFECKTNNHLFYAFKMSLPIFFIIAIVFPLFILYRLYNNRNNLYKVSLYLTLGFFYQEYSPKKYYWEIIRMSYRTLIYVASTYFSQQQLLKSVILSIITSFYLVLTHQNQPYRTKIQNKLDFMVAFSMIICFQLGVINTHTKDKYLQGFSILFIIILNIGIIIFFVLSILKERITIQKKQLFYPVFIFLIKCMPQVFGRIFKEQKSCFIFHNGWKKVQHIVFENKLPLLRLRLNLQSLPSQKIDFTPQSQQHFLSQFQGQLTTKNNIPTQLELIKFPSNFTNFEAIVVNTLNTNTKQTQNASNKHFAFLIDSFEAANQKVQTPPAQIIVNESEENNFLFSSRANMNPLKQASEPKTMEHINK